MMKRIISLFLLISVMIGLMPSNSYAEEDTKKLVYVKVYNGKTTENHEILAKDGEIYFQSHSYELFTSYRFLEGEDHIGLVMGRKKILIEKESGNMQIPVLHYNGNIGKPIVIDGEYYLPASLLLPWLNVACGTSDGVLEIIPDGTSLWKIVDDFKYSDYMFNLYEEYGDSFQSVAGLTAMTTFDTLINLRWERLVSVDGVSGAFHNGSLYDYECYISALIELAQTQPFTGENAKKTVKNVINVNKGLGVAEEVFGTEMLSDEMKKTWSDLNKEIDSYGKVLEYMDIFSVLKMYEVITLADQEYVEYLRWLSEQKTDNRLLDRAIDDTVKMIGEEWGVIATAYGKFGKALISELPSGIVNAIGSNSLDENVKKACNRFSEGIFGSLSDYMLVAKIVYGYVIPVAKGYEGMAKVGINESIQDYCWSLAEQLQQEEMTKENIQRIRQSYLTALRISKMSYEAMQHTMDVRMLGIWDVLKGEGLMDYKLNPIDDKIDCLIASVDTTENDSVEGKEKYTNTLKELFENITLEKNRDAVQIIIEWDGINPDSGELVNLEVFVESLENKLLVFEGEEIYSEDGELLLVYKKEMMKNNGVIKITLFDLEGSYSFTGEDADYNPESWNYISLANARATIIGKNGKRHVLYSKEGLWRAYTGFWFWGICSIEEGKPMYYTYDWIYDESISQWIYEKSIGAEL